MAARKEFASKQPFKDLHINGPLYLLIQADVLTETFLTLGATIRRAFCNISSTQDQTVDALPTIVA